MCCGKFCDRQSPAYGRHLFSLCVQVVALIPTKTTKILVGYVCLYISHVKCPLLCVRCHMSTVTNTDSHSTIFLDTLFEQKYSAPFLLDRDDIPQTYRHTDGHLNFKNEGNSWVFVQKEKKILPVAPCMWWQNKLGISGEKWKLLKKSRIRETKHLSTDADISTNTTAGWPKNTQKPKFIEKRKKSSKLEKLKTVQKYAKISNTPFDQRSLIHWKAWFPGRPRIPQNPNCLKNGKNYQKRKNSKTSKNMPKLAIRPLTIGL